MNTKTSLILSIILGGFFLSSCVQSPDNLPKSEWIYPDTKGKLVYKKDERGNRIMDFSYAGYMGGGVALPDVTVKVTVNPPADPQTDCTALIQDAIDQVSAMPQDDKGFRGAVLLMPGKYLCSKAITISADGVIVRGSGKTENGSIIYMTGGQHTAVVLAQPNRERGDNRQGSSEDKPKPVKITENYIPAGSISFSVADASGFKAGDRVKIRKPATAKWIEYMQMHNLVRYGTPQNWISVGTQMSTERFIASVKDNIITLDAPLVDSYDAGFSDDDINIILANDVKWLRQAGLENLRIECPFQAVGHGGALYTAVRLNGEDCWLRDLDILETMNSVAFGGLRITAQRVNVYRRALHRGASKPAEFAPNASQLLLDQCSVDADNVWFVAVGSNITGPMVFLNCRFTGNSVIEGHQRWSIGMLLDNCILPDGGIEYRNRGVAGSGHGWSLGWSVVWNCIARHLIVQSPPGATNWCIGSTGERMMVPRNLDSAPLMPEGIFDSYGMPVAPRSLYLAQLSERLGAKALKAIGYEPGSPAARELENPTMPERRFPPPAPIDPEFGKDLFFLLPVDAGSMRESDTEDPNKYSAYMVLDGNMQTCWMPAVDIRESNSGGKRPCNFEIDANPPVVINTITISEPEGMTNIREYKIEGAVDNEYKILAEGTTIGARKTHTFSEETVWKVRMTITKSDGTPAISNISGHYKE